MEGEVMEAPEPAEDPCLVPAADFWELHRQLANCYVADMLRGKCSPNQMEVTELLWKPVQQRSHSRREGIQKRREKSLKSLKIQLQGVPRDDASSSTVALLPHQCWGDSKSKVPKGKRGRSKDVPVTGRSSVKPTAELGDVPERSCVLHPGGSFRTAWNLSMALCVLYDLMLVPLNAFDVPPSVVLDIFDWMIQIFWNLDFFISFITGYYDEGTLVFSLRKIAWHYAKTWLLFDVALLSMDWACRSIELSNPAGMESIMWSRSLRMLRFLRLMRMLRMVKLRRINEVFQEFFHSQTATLYYSLFSSLIHLCILNHLIACAWFAVSHVSSDENWVTVLGIENSSMEYQYLTCMHWAFTQLGVGSNPALATNVTEMAYCIVIAFRSLITAATLISTVSNLMAGLSKIKENENTQFRLLRAYMAQNHIEPQLAQKITRFLQYQYTLQQEARSADMEVPLLEMLSPQLKGELQFARSRRDLCKLQVLNELFEFPDRQVVHILHRVAQDAVKNLVVAAADLIFLAGNPAPSAFLKLSGELTYCNEDTDEGDETVSSEVWIAEVALWTPWHYLGDLVSADVSRVSSLNVEVFCHALSTSWQTQRAASRYAATFLDKMISLNHWTDTFVLPREGQAGALPHRPERGHSWRWSKQRCCCFAQRSPKVDDFSAVAPR